MYALAAFFPILAVIIMMAGFNLSSKSALPVGWVLAVCIAVLVWNVRPSDAAGYSIYGALKSFDVILIIFGAILLHEMGHALVGRRNRHRTGYWIRRTRRKGSGFSPGD